MLVVNRSIQIPRSELKFRYVRSSGPGGQNVNKVSSKAELRWNAGASTALPEDVRGRFLERYAARISQAGEIIVTSQSYRDQPRNTSDCLRKLKSMILAVAEPPPKRKTTRPTHGSRERRLKAKRNIGEKKQSRQSPNWE